MQLKDYYKILGVIPTATMVQVKKSFRQLALRYHPDKNPGDALAEAKFQEIQEAYETLIDPEKRAAYNYKRWYNRSIQEPFIQEALSPAAILNECIRLNNYINSINALRVDFDALSYHIRRLLSNKNIGILKQFNDEAINSNIIEKIMLAGGLLPFQYIEPVAAALLRIAGDNGALISRIQHFVSERKQQANWQRYRAVFVIVFTALLCWIIYMISR